MARHIQIPNIEQTPDKIAGVKNTLDLNKKKIESTLQSKGLAASGADFSRKNVNADLGNDKSIMIKSGAPIQYPNNVVESFTVSADDLKRDTSFNSVEDPSTRITSNASSHTIHSDTASGNLDIQRWTTRCVFKFREDDYGYDRRIYEIPLKYLMEGSVGNSGRHNKTYQGYPYPEEIIMVSPTKEKSFIHFVNAQYTDGHVNHYGGNPYNIMIALERPNWGVPNAENTGFENYLSVYANNIDSELAFVQNEYLYIPMPDKSFGDDLLNTMWDCRVVWRHDPPNRTVAISYDAEIAENDSMWKWADTQNELSNYHDHICYGNGKYVALTEGAEGNNIIAYSTDGIEWTEVGTDTSGHVWTSICYGNGKFIGLSINLSFIISTDGIEWTEITTSMSNYQWTSICYGKDKFVALAENSKRYAYSTDGINWTEGTNTLDIGTWSNVCYSGDRFVALSDNTNDQTSIIVSFDGLTWTEWPQQFHANILCCGDNKFVALSDNDNLTNNIIAYSTDGIIWETLENTEIISSICYGNNQFLYVGPEVFGISTNGKDWTIKRQPADGYLRSNDRVSICYGDNKYVSTNGNKFSYYFAHDKKFQSRTIKEINGRLLYSTTDSTKVDKVQKYKNTIPEKNSPNSLTPPTDIKRCCNNSIAVSNGIVLSPKYTKLHSINNWFDDSPDIIIRVNDMYLLGINYTQGFKYRNISEYTILDNKLNPLGDHSSGKTCIHKLFDDTIFHYYIKNILFTEQNTTNIEIYFYTPSGRRKCTITVAADGAPTTVASELEAYPNFTAVNIIRINKNEFLIMDNQNKIHSHNPSVDGFSFTDAPYGISSVGAYFISAFSLASVDANKIQMLGTSYSKDPALTISSGDLVTDINGMGILDGISHHNTTGKFAVMKNGSGKHDLVHLKEKYTLSGAFDPSPQPRYELRWKDVNPGIDRSGMPKIGNVKSVCYGNGKFVACADRSSNFAYSVDGVVWTLTTSGIGEGDWKSICYGNDKFVAIAYRAPLVLYSTDGINWEYNDRAFSDRSWQSICYGDRKFVAVAETSDTFAYSSDGITWTETAGNLTRVSWRSVCYGNYKFVAISSTYDKIAYSADGITWTESTNTVSGTWQSICYGSYYDNSAKFVVVGSGNRVAYSIDGINWTETVAGLSDRSWNFVCHGGPYGNYKYIAISSRSNAFAYSTDGITWTETTSGLSSRDWESVCYGSGVFVAVDRNENVSYSIDGITWIEVNRFYDLTRICYGNNKYVGMGYGNRFVYSTDGVNWRMTDAVFDGNLSTSICYGGDKFVAVATGPTFIYSTDGIMWTPINHGVAGSYDQSIYYANGKFVAVSSFYSNSFAYSTDGITWAGTTNGLNYRNWKSICYGGDKFVVTSSRSNTFAYSTDGITWVETNAGLPEGDWQSICYGKDKFVAVDGGANIFVYSTDGITWTQTNNGIPQRKWTSVCYSDNKYIAITSDTAHIVYSENGIDWIEGETNATPGGIIYPGNGNYIITHPNQVNLTVGATEAIYD